MMRKALLLATMVLIVGLALVAYLTTDRFGPLVQADALIPDHIEKISARHSGNGYLYTTTDPKVISLLIGALQSTEYRQAYFHDRIVGGGDLVLSTSSGLHQLKLTAIGPMPEDQRLYVDGVYYKPAEIINEEINAFYSAFFVDQNIARGQ